MNSSSQFINMVHEALSSECCVICGKEHNVQKCDYIQISKYVPDTPIPARAKLTLPDFLEVRILSDSTFSTITKAPISKGTQFGPFQADKIEFLSPTVIFPLKVFSLDENGNVDWYLDSNNEDKCSWLMYVPPAAYTEEQNLICYQDKEAIYYVAIKDINTGDALKVWYSPYYGLKMNKPVLFSKAEEDLLSIIDIDSLIKNQQNIMERKVWTCKFCSRLEENIVNFARHILKHYTAQHKNMCELCRKTFGSKKNLKNHMKIVHKMFFPVPPPKPKIVENVSNIQCKDVALGGPLLNDIFTDSTDLQQSDFNQFDLNLDNQNLLLDNDNLNVENLLNDNVKDLDHFNFEIDDTQKQFVCDICLKQFTKVKLLIIHLRHHTGDFMCFKCLKVFCRKENLKSHICNLTIRYRCNLCEKTFAQKKYLERHLQGVHRNRFQCISCMKKYHSKKELVEHNCSGIPIEDKEKFICSICNKQFLRNLYLKRHMKLHNTVKPKKVASATCDVCGYYFENRNSYYLHKKIHQEPSFLCNVCDKKFHRHDSLTEHMVIHQDDTPFECLNCDKKFKSRKILGKHMKTHSHLNVLKCSFCSMTFKCRPNLTKHMRNVHSSHQPNGLFEFYNCPHCDRSVKLKSSLIRHLKKVHPETNINPSSITPRIVESIKDANVNDNSLKENDILTDTLNAEIDDQITNLLKNAENDLSLQKQAVDNLVEELDIERIKEKKQLQEVCLSIPEYQENYQEIKLDKNAYILDNGTIVQPQADSENLIIYVLDQDMTS